MLIRYIDLLTSYFTEFHEANRDNELFANTEDPEYEFDESGLQLASKEGTRYIILILTIV